MLEPTGQDDDVARVLMRTAIAYLQMNCVEKAENVFQRASEIVGRVGSPDLTAECAALHLEIALALSAPESRRVQEAIRRARETRKLPSSFAMRMRLDAVLASAYFAAHNPNEMNKYFASYYNGLKFACSELSAEIVASFSRNSTFLDLIEKQKRGNKKESPDR